MGEVTELDLRVLEGLSGYMSFREGWLYRQFMRCPARRILFATGNQYGKTVTVARQYVARYLGLHPVEWKNRLRRVWRFASETLPNESDGSGEVRNTVYPAFKRFLPDGCIKKDITHRRPTMVLRDPFGGGSGEGDTVVEFVSYGQTVQSQAGVQRSSIWMDEESPKDFYDEQLPRLLAEGGDLIVTCTPARVITWLHDELYDRARWYVRTARVARKLGYGEMTHGDFGHVEVCDSGEDIAVFQAATDDNPTLGVGVIDDLLGGIDDPDVEMIRRYGIFKQVSGRIFKDFDFRVHVVDGGEVFPGGIPYEWVHANLVDYHEAIPWAVSFVALSDTDELFVYDEFSPPVDYVTLDIVREMVLRRGDYSYDFNLIDPLAAKVQKNTSTSVVDDLNRLFLIEKRAGRVRGSCYWRTWDTKSTRGREEIRRRLKNSLRVGRPFSNLVTERGERKYLPTIWFLRRCRHHIQSMSKWRLEEWQAPVHRHTKERKEKPQAKWSHYPCCLEAILKERGFRPRAMRRGGLRRVVSERYFRQRR